MSDKKLPHDKVVRITEVALAAVVAHADAHEVTRYEAADTLILAGAAAEEALADAEVPAAPAGRLALSEEALAVVAAWAEQAHHNDLAGAASDLVLRAWRRLDSLRVWRPKASVARKAAREERRKRKLAEMGEIADAVVATCPKAPASSTRPKLRQAPLPFEPKAKRPKKAKGPTEFYVPGETWDQAEFERIGRIRESDIGNHWVAVDLGGGRWAKLGDGTVIRVFNRTLRDGKEAARASFTKGAAQ
jgi:hypothetical protein